MCDGRKLAHFRPTLIHDPGSILRRPGCGERSEPDRDRRVLNAMHGMQCRITFLVPRLAPGPRAGDLRPSRCPTEASVQVTAMTITQCMVCNRRREFPRDATVDLPGSVRKARGVIAY